MEDEENFLCWKQSIFVSVMAKIQHKHCVFGMGNLI